MKSKILAALAMAGAAWGVHSAETKAAAAPAATSPSVLEGYRRYAELPPIEWRRANEDAAALGGHVGQIRGKPARSRSERHSSGKPGQGGAR